MHAWQGRDEALQTIVANANAFTEVHTCGTARMRYTHRALEQYKTLFVDMDSVIQKHVWPIVQEQLERSKRAPGNERLDWDEKMAKL